jgi:hypothetical protein
LVPDDQVPDVIIQLRSSPPQAGRRWAVLLVSLVGFPVVAILTDPGNAGADRIHGFVFIVQAEVAVLIELEDSVLPFLNWNYASV